MIQQIANNPQTTNALREDISKTRRRMDQTLDRLADRLQPRHLLNDLLDFWQTHRHNHPEGSPLADVLQGNARRAGETLAGVIRDHPVPTVLITTGVAWLFFGQSRSRSHQRPGYSAYPSTGEPGQLAEDHFSDPYLDQNEEDPMTDPDTEHGGGTLTEAKSKAARLASDFKTKMRYSGQKLRQRAVEQGHDLSERAGAAGHELQDRMREGYRNVQERVREGYDRTRERLKEATSTHPLAASAAFLGIGLLAGFLLPGTRREDEWFGDTSDNVRHRIKETGQDLVERGKEIADAAAQAARSEAQRQGLTPEQLKKGLLAVGKETTEAAKQAAEEQGALPK
jgi:ElaB/YqjD/DUF883 family membrane-anchored ribosome-binding protein